MQVGSPVLVSIPAKAPIKSKEGVQYLIAVRPPNMNEDKPDPLGIPFCLLIVRRANR